MMMAAWSAFITAAGSENGKHLDVDCCLVFQLEDARITAGTEHFRDLYAWDEFWS